MIGVIFKVGIDYLKGGVFGGFFCYYFLDLLEAVGMC